MSAVGFGRHWEGHYDFLAGRGIADRDLPFAIDGTLQLTLTPMELLDRLARFIPPPCRHLHRYHGVFAPNARLRPRIAARAGQPVALPHELSLGAPHRALLPSRPAALSTLRRDDAFCRLHR